MNRWYFWVLAPALLGTALIVIVAAEPASIAGHVTAYGLVAVLLLATIGLANLEKFGWAFRGVAVGIFAAALAYFASELLAWQAGKPLGAFGPRSTRSLWNAGLFLLVFGLPALSYLLSGRSGTVVDVIASADSVPSEATEISSFDSHDKPQNY
jgi:hypothetical protein